MSDATLTQNFHWIKNPAQIATTNLRTDGLSILEAGLDAIDTTNIVKQKVRLKGQLLQIENQVYDLQNFRRIKVVGFGKASCNAAFALDSILGKLVQDSAVIGLEPIACEYIKTYGGSHPKPSQTNVESCRNLVSAIKDVNKDDLVIVLVSGGGSALACWPETENQQSQKLYNSYLGTGGSIEKLNTVRKHLSLLKGGGLAKMLYPATVIGLIFSDLPEDRPELVASGPTYKDTTTITNAKKIAEEENLGEFDFLETPKEDKYFEKVQNFVLVDILSSVQAMESRARTLGYTAETLSTQLRDEPAIIIKNLLKKAGKGKAVLGGGEAAIKINRSGGSGGRNQFTALIAHNKLNKNQVLIASASDGLDNGPAAGGIMDKIILEKAAELNLNPESFIKKFNAFEFFDKTEGLIQTDPTGANVADLIILLTEK